MKILNSNYTYIVIFVIFNIFHYLQGLKKTKYEGAEYFGFRHHIQDFVGFDNEDHDAIELAFSKMKIEARMEWLQAPQVWSSLHMLL